MSKQPFLPLFFGDFLAATAEWGGEEASLYLTLLGHQWSLGSLPADPMKICRLVRWDSRLFGRCWPTVRSKFVARDEDGRLVNPRLEEHRSRSKELSEIRAEIGRRGGEASGQVRREAKGKQLLNGSYDFAEAKSNHLSHPILSHPKEESLLTESKPTVVAQNRDSGPVQRVFDHWKTAWSHPRAKLDSKRKRVITAALKSYAEADLVACIDGYLNSPHHLGENERSTRYDSIELFLRDAQHIDAGIAFTAPKVNGSTWNCDRDLVLTTPSEMSAFRAAREQGRTFKSQEDWEAFRRG